MSANGVRELMLQTECSKVTAYKTPSSNTRQICTLWKTHLKMDQGEKTHKCVSLYALW